MGDRCYLTINLHGHIDTVGKLYAIIDALRIEHMHPLDQGESDDAVEFLTRKTGEAAQ